MLDIKQIRENPEFFRQALERRSASDLLDTVLDLDAQRRKILVETEALKAKRNEVSSQIPQMKKRGEPTEVLIQEMKSVSNEIKVLDENLSEIETRLNDSILRIPNAPSQLTPDGKDENDNIEVRKIGTPRAFDFEPKPHWEIGENLGVLDFQTAAKVTGARFTFYKDLGARLERSLINFMLNTHIENGYTEVFPPFMVNRASMTGTGQLPKFEEDAFSVSNMDYFLTPTAEVPVTNMFRNSILTPEDLPLSYCAYSACFRAEAGSAGRDTRGLIRQHQFNKVELVKFSKPESSYEELEKLTADAEKILKLLGLPYRVVALCAGDIGFSSAKTYDLEVWMPSYNRYVEISSCSNCEDYQARRANIKYRPSVGAKAEFLHTLNGSGVAVGRTVAAVLENYQAADGSVHLPEVLTPYMGTDLIGG